MLLIVILVLIVVVYVVAPYARAMSLIVRVAAIGGAAQAVLSLQDTTVEKQPRHEIHTRHGTVPAQLYMPARVSEHAVLVMPGFNSNGIDEPRLAALAAVGAPAHAAPIAAQKSPFSTDEAPTRHEDAISYNNFYEFGTAKTDPAAEAGGLKVSPWSVKIDGLVGKPQTLALEDILKPVTLEERIYRLRCVEGWSMVIPWIGFPLADLLKRVEPMGSAKYVAFETLVRPEDEIAMPAGSRPPRDYAA